MANHIEIRFKSNNIEKISQEIRERVASLVAKTAEDIVADAKRNAPVRTGFLRNSIESDVDRKGNASFSRITATIRVKASYGIFVEIGTRKMAAQPFLIPAVESSRQAFLDAMKNILK
jgi:HK97 gp10 family phage protein